MRLGILTSHPIQYQSPWFRALAKEVNVHVYFAHRQTAAQQADAGFGVAFDWDVDLLSGFRHTFLPNVAKHPDVNRFAGCDTPEIARIINAENFDSFVVCGWYLKSYRQAVKACRRAGVPVLVRGDSQLRTPRPFLRRCAMEVRQRWLLQQFDGFLSVGQRHREYLEHFGVRPEKIFPAPHFVDNEWFGRKAEEVRGCMSEVRGQWGAGERDVVALFVGKFIPKKRPADLLRAMAKLQGSDTLPTDPKAGRVTPCAPSEPSVQASGAHGVTRPTRASFMVVFVGSGELEAELREIAAREKLRAHFAGFKNQSELPACYASADVLVLPSDGGETWGLVVNEAMACGLPAIVSDAVGCAPDLIEDDKTGFTYPAGDVAALADRMAQLLRLKQRGHDFANAAREKVGSYSMGAAVQGTLQAAETLTQTKRA